MMSRNLVNTLDPYFPASSVFDLPRSLGFSRGSHPTLAKSQDLSIPCISKTATLSWGLHFSISGDVTEASTKNKDVHMVMLNHSLSYFYPLGLGKKKFYL